VHKRRQTTETTTDASYSYLSVIKPDAGNARMLAARYRFSSLYYLSATVLWCC